MTDYEQDAYECLQVRPDAHALVIQAAYRALASLYHPDRDPSSGATYRMVALNRAFEKLRTPDRRALYDQQRKLGAGMASAIVTPPPSPAGRNSAARTGSDVVDFGRYNGLTIMEIARQDPDYLKWLRRHSSGIRYRAQIDVALGVEADRASGARLGDRSRRGR